MIIETRSAPERRSVGEVLGIPSGPSRRGSTYWSRLLRCPREFYLASKLHWGSTRSTDALDGGLIWHHMLEIFYRDRLAWQEKCRQESGGKIDRRDPHYLAGNPNAGRRLFEALAPFAGEGGYEELYGLLERMADVYLHRWFDMWEILAVEHTVEQQLAGTPNTPPFEFSTRLDAVVLDWSGAEPCLRIIEHKSTYRMDGDVLEGYQQDFQVLGQVWLVERGVDLRRYPPFLGTIVNVVSRTKNPSAERILVQPWASSLASWERSLRYQVSLMPQHEAAGWPKNYSSCVRRFGKCEFFELCRSFPDLEPDALAARDAAEDLPSDYRKRRLPVLKEDL